MEIPQSPSEKTTQFHPEKQLAPCDSQGPQQIQLWQGDHKLWGTMGFLVTGTLFGYLK